MLRSRRCSPIRLRICACTVTSSAVVGSSANRTFGPQAKAMAIITRWRIPPESSCGYCRSRRAGSGIRTSTSSRSAISRAELRSMPRWTRSGSAICSPMRISGLSEPIGSWNTVDIDRPQISRSCLSVRSISSTPSKRIDPERSIPPPAMSPMIERVSTVLPDPDSPTMPTASPRCSDNDTPSTARTTPRGVLKCVTRSRTSSISRPRDSTGSTTGEVFEGSGEGEGPVQRDPNRPSRVLRRSGRPAPPVDRSPTNSAERRERAQRANE